MVLDAHVPTRGTCKGKRLHTHPRAGEVPGSRGEGGHWSRRDVSWMEQELRCVGVILHAFGWEATRLKPRTPLPEQAGLDLPPRLWQQWAWIGDLAPSQVTTPSEALPEEPGPSREQQHGVAPGCWRPPLAPRRYSSVVPKSLCPSTDSSLKLRAGP